jgi:hypothetical protein
MWKHNILSLTLNPITPLYYILFILIISTLFCIEMNQNMGVVWLDRKSIGYFSHVNTTNF